MSTALALAAEPAVKPAESPFLRIWRRFRRRRTAMIGFAVVVIMTLVAVFAGRAL